MPLLARLIAALSSARNARASRRAAAALRTRLAALPQDTVADETVDFLFSREAEVIEPWQIVEEFRALVRRVAARRPRTVLEIGTADGGSLFAYARLAHAEALVISVDLPDGPFGGGYEPWRIPLYESFARPRQRLELIRADSHAPSTSLLLERILDGRRIDFAFIDGDHSYEGVRRDFELCRRLAAPDAMIAFHDIVERPNPEYVEQSGSCAPEDWAVHRFWQEIRQEYEHEEFVQRRDQHGYGIGVLHLGGAPPAADRVQ